MTGKDPATLRAAAEARLQAAVAAEASLQATVAASSAPPADADLLRLVHELQVHQIELEMQNESLRRAHLAMEEARDHYVEFYELAPVGYVSLTDKGRIVAANITAAELLGVDRKTLLGRRFDALVRADDRERCQQLFSSLLQSDASAQIELALERADAGMVHIRLDCRRAVLGGVLPVVHVALADISERKRAELEAACQLRRIESLLQHAHDCILMLDADTRIVTVSDSCLATYGYSRAQLLSMKAAELRVPELRGVAPDLHSLTKPGSLSYRTWHCRQDGSRFPVEVGATLIELDGERSYQAIVRDIGAAGAGRR